MVQNYRKGFHGNWELTEPGKCRKHLLTEKPVITSTTTSTHSPSGSGFPVRPAADQEAGCPVLKELACATCSLFCLFAASAAGH